jgi:hypothetical protein
VDEMNEAQIFRTKKELETALWFISQIIPGARVVVKEFSLREVD